MALKRSHLGPNSPQKRIGGVEIFCGSVSLGGWPIRPGATLFKYLYVGAPGDGPWKAKSWV